MFPRFSYSFFFLLTILFPGVVLAAGQVGDVEEGLNMVARENYDAGLTVYSYVGVLINVVLGLSGLAFLLVVVYGGILYLVDRGAGETVKKAKTVLTYGILGIILIVSSFAISTFVFQQLGTIGNDAKPVSEEKPATTEIKQNQAPGATGGDNKPAAPPAEPWISVEGPSAPAIGGGTVNPITGEKPWSWSSVWE